MTRVARAFLVAVSLAGCTLLRPTVPPGETRVGQGKLYECDNPAYDEFFVGVHEVQKQATDANDDEAKARAPLEHALGTRSAPPERLVELTKERVKRGREGPPVHVGVTGLEAAKQGEPPPKVVATVTVPDEAAIPPSQREVVQSLVASAKAEAEIAERFSAVSAKARSLLARHGQLVTSVNRDFATASRRDEVSNELGASKPILVGALDRAEKISGGARAFLKGMTEAFPSGTAGVAVGKDEKPGAAKAQATPPKGAPPPPHPGHPSKSAEVAPPRPAPKPPVAMPAKHAAEPASPAPVPEPPPAPPPKGEPERPKPASEDFNP